jgi:phage tail protein X
LESSLPKLIKESVRWSRDETKKAGWTLQGGAKREKNSNRPKYFSMFLAGAYLEACALPDDPHAIHIKKTIEAFLAYGQDKEVVSSSEWDDVFEFIATCLTAPLSIHYSEVNKNLEDLLINIEMESDWIAWRIYAITFGMIDAVAQKMGLTQSKHLVFAIEFFISRMGKTPDSAAEIVGKLTAIRPGMALFQYIHKAGEVVSNVEDCSNLDGLLDLSELLHE